MRLRPRIRHSVQVAQGLDSEVSHAAVGCLGAVPWYRVPFLSNALLLLLLAVQVKRGRF